MSKHKQQIIVVATNNELKNKHYYSRLWLAARNIPIPRRNWLDEIADCFCHFDGKIVHKNGQPYEIPFVDDVFNDDIDMRWLGVFFQADLSGLMPKRYSNKFKRLQLIDLYFRIKHPDIARHFGR